MIALQRSFKDILGETGVPPTTTEPSEKDMRLKCADFFCGIGGFHVAAKNLGLDVVFACDIDEDVRRAYQTNYGLVPRGDIVGLRPDDVPDHDILFAGFPCQPFSIIGRQRGFADPRGTPFLSNIAIHSRQASSGRCVGKC